MARKKKHDQSIKEWAILRLKKGYISKQIATDIQKLYGVYVAMNTVYRWRKAYIQDTGKHIPLKRKEKQKKKIKK